MEKFHGCMILLFAGKLSRSYTNLKHLIIRKKKFAGKPLRLEANLRKPQKFSTANDLHYTVVPQRDAATLLPLINAHVAPGTIIHSDEWAAYNRAQRLSNVSSHGVVNHSINFVKPTTGVHTQNVESYWNRVKIKLKRMKGCHGDQLPSYLNEFMWKERHAWYISITGFIKYNEGYCSSISSVTDSYKHYDPLIRYSN